MRAAAIGGEPGYRTSPDFATELERLVPAGNLTTDAHLAVLAMERGYVLYSTERRLCALHRLALGESHAGD